MPAIHDLIVFLPIVPISFGVFKLSFGPHGVQELARVTIRKTRQDLRNFGFITFFDPHLPE